MRPSFVTYFDPQPAPAELPVRLASPFAPGPPHPLAHRAAQELQRLILGGSLGLGSLDEPGHGKMFGVLAVATPEGRIGYLRGFSGMLGERWLVEGFVPPLFDFAARDAFWPAGQAELYALEDHHTELTQGAEPVALRARLAELSARHASAAQELRARHEENRRQRHEARRRLDEAGTVEAERHAALHALGQESRADAAERQHLEQAHHQEREGVASALRALDARRAELEHRRAKLSRQLWRQMASSYLIPNARGEQRTVGALFAPEPPPGGAGDCAAPKLLACAYRQGLRPLALAEFWWGAPPLTGERHTGEYYPACQSKCGGVLPYMLEGLEVEPAPEPSAGLEAEAALRIVYGDPWLLAVDKPCGLLSMPGRHSPLRDSVLVRLQRQFPDAPGLLLMHPLDAEASGLVLVARDEATHAALQRQFSLGEADKRYTAWLTGPVAGSHGTVELPLGGKRALTEWQVTQRDASQTRVSLLPRTARTHQLRAHAAHPLGLGAPIVGDRLYGGSGPRLMLHAQSVMLLHPQTGKRLQLECPAPY